MKTINPVGIVFMFWSVWMAVLFECQKPCRFQITKEKNIPLSSSSFSSDVGEYEKRSIWIVSCVT